MLVFEGITGKGEHRNMIRRDDYRKRFAGLEPNLYRGGKTIDRFDPKKVGGMSVMAATCDTAFGPAYEDPGTATVHITGEKINRSCHISLRVENLRNKQNMSCLSSQEVAGCTRCCMGIDARYGGGSPDGKIPHRPQGVEPDDICLGIRGKCRRIRIRYPLLCWKGVRDSVIQGKAETSHALISLEKAR